MRRGAYTAHLKAGSKGAGVYFGWTGRANSGTCFTSARYFVDRLVGANRFMKESPDQRAFPWDLVYDDMKKRGLVIATADLLIGVTALHHGYAVGTRNLRHFGMIPGLKVLSV